jgi:hypothetical protein
VKEYFHAQFWEGRAVARPPGYPVAPVMHPSGTYIQVCFDAKEILDRRTVQSERAVLIRVHRINAATSERSAGTKTNCPNDGVEQETPNEAKKNSQNVKHFSLKCFAGSLPISGGPAMGGSNR